MTCTLRSDDRATRSASHRLRALWPILALALAVAGTGCGSSGGSDASQAGPQLGKPSNQAGLTAWGQSLRAQDDGGEWTPGFANMWDLDRDFTIATGGEDHFDGALSMRVDLTSFPADQTYSELQFMTPFFGTGDGITAAVVFDGSISGWSPLAGTYSVVVAPTQDARLTQTLDLTTAVAPISIEFMTDVVIDISGSNFTTQEQFIDVSIRNTANGVLQQLYYRNTDGADVSTVMADLSAYAGEVVRLSIRARSTPHSYIVLDGFSVMDDDSVEFVLNGGFETGALSGWSRNTPSFVRNVTSGVRTVDGLEVTRSFYAEPTARWSRMVDVFTNPSGATVDRTITYEVDLGSNGEGIIYGSDAAGTIYDMPDVTNQAITTWDSANGKRDIGWAFGNATSVDWTSDDALGASGNGDEVVTVTYDLSVPPGASVALAHFVVLDTDDTGDTAASVNDTADTVDTELSGILNGWPADGTVNRYTSGMTQAQIDAVANF